MQQQQKAQLQKLLENMAKEANLNFADFKEAFQANPAGALRQCGSTYVQATAARIIADQALALLNCDISLDDLLKEFETQVLNTAMGPQGLFNVESLIDQALQSKRAKFVSQLKEMQKFGQLFSVPA